MCSNQKEMIYILINEAMPGYVKIGQTTNLEQRIRSLDTTSVPLPFECFYACSVDNANFVEKQLHDTFMDQRVRSSREFFEVSPERVVSALKLAEIENVTPNKDLVETEEDRKALDDAKERRSKFNFRMADIPIGTEITFIDDKNIKARVINQIGKKTILFNGKETSPSAAAQKIRGYSYQIQGTLYWMYEEETLDERRRRIERGE